MSDVKVSSIAKLDRDVSRMIQSQVTIDSYSSAVRELIYNSVDAGASKIDITLDLQSLSILIIDNGGGMVLRDLELVGKRHFTSKLKSIEELESISTFGYRGEALSSLALISSLTMISKHETSECFRLKCSSIREVSRYTDSQLPHDLFYIAPIQTHGTAVRVANLFSNVPVRKMLLSKVSESSMIEEIKHIVLDVLVARPLLVTIGKIEHGNQQISSLLSVDSHGQDSASILRAIYGKSILKSYQTLTVKSEVYLLKGIIGDEPINTKRHQYIFINSKSFLLPKEDSRSLNALFDGAFSTDFTSPSKFTAVGRPYHKFPISLIQVSSNLPPEWTTIKELVKRVFRDFLRAKGYYVTSNPARPSPRKRTRSPMKQDRDEICSELFEHFDEIQLSKLDLVQNNYRIIRQIDNKFILIRFAAVTRTKAPYLVIMDQHACDERIKVEELYKQFIFEVMLHSCMLRLMNVIEFEVSQAECDSLAHFKDNFNLFGINYVIDDELVQVTHLPHLLIERMDDVLYLKSSILQHLYDLEHHIKSPKVIIDESQWFSMVVQLPRAIVDIIKSKACRMSIRFGDPLLDMKMEDMVSSLRECYLPFQCAHGRPSVVPLVNLKNI